MLNCENSNLELLRSLKDSYNKAENLLDQKIRNDKHIFYLNFINSDQIWISQENLFKMELIGSNSILGEYNIYKNQKEKEQISLYYFQNIIENNNIQEIDLHELTKIKLIFNKLAQLKQQLKIKIFLHYHENKIDNLKVTIQNHIYQLFDGLFDEQQNVILILSKSEYKYLECNLASMIDLQIDQIFFECQEFNNQLIDKLNSSFNYSTFKFNDFLSIGYQCYKYLTLLMEVITKQLINQLLLIQNNINKLLELPFNIDEEISSDANSKRFSQLLLQFIIRFNQIIQQENVQIEIIIPEIKQAINRWETPISDNLKLLAEKHEKINIFCKNKQTNFIFKFESYTQQDLEVLKLFQNNYFNNTDLIKQELKIIAQQNDLWLKYFDVHLPQSLKLLQDIPKISEHYEKTDKLVVSILGLTKVGKSTLLNILTDCKNLNVTQIHSHNKYCFTQKTQVEDIKISNRCYSETQFTFDIEIENIIFIDTPGFYDTSSQKRLSNQINIFTQLQRSPQIVLLILIDGEKLCENKNDLFQTLEHINIFFGNKLIESKLDYFILPIFNKLEQNTMNQIKQIWDEEIYKDCEQYQSFFLKTIKNQIDQNRYIEIYKAQYYIDNKEILDLKNRLKAIKTQIKELINDKKQGELLYLSEKKQELKNKKIQQELQPKELLYNQLNEIKNKIVLQCNILKQEQIQHQAKLIFSCNLNPELQKHYNKVILYSEKLCHNLVNVITDLVINDFLSNQSIKVGDIINYINLIETLVMKYESQQQQSVLSLFNSLIKLFPEKFKHQNVIRDIITKLKAVSNLTSFISHDKQEKISLGYLKQEIKLLKTVCIENNKVQKSPKIKEMAKMLKNSLIISISILASQSYTIYQKQQQDEQQERLKMVIVKFKYLKSKQKQYNNNQQ